MSNKRVLTALLIIGVLAIAFFWGGDYGKSPTKLTEGNAETGVIRETATPPHAEEQRAEAEAETEADRDPLSNAAPEETLETTQATQAAEATEATEFSEATAGETEPLVKPVEPVEKKSVEKPSNKDGDTTPAAEATQAPAADLKQDKYLTDPVPEGKPKPVEWQDVTVDTEKKLTVTLSVTAKTILNNMDIFNKDKLEVLPADGIIYKAQAVTFYEGESVFDVLLREMRKNKIHMEFTMTPIYNSNYIEGINNLYEFDCGELSGWMYKVNGWYPNYGSSRYVLQDRDVVDWVYTCDLGRDIGGYVATGAGKE